MSLRSSQKLRSAPPVAPAVPLPRIVTASLGMPSATSWSRAASAAPRGSYIAVRVRSAIDGVSFLGDGAVRAAALEPLDLGPLRPERHRLADVLGAAPLGDPDLLLEDQLGGDHEPLLEHGDDQHPVLLAHRRGRLHHAADRGA